MDHMRDDNNGSQNDVINDVSENMSEDLSKESDENGREELKSSNRVFPKSNLFNFWLFGNFLS